MNKATRPNELGSLRKTDSTKEIPSEIARIREHLLSGTSINRRKAERIGDRCLLSTISALANGYYVTFERQSEQALNQRGEPCEVAGYSLLPYEHGCVLLADLRHLCHKQPDDHERLIAPRR